MFHSSNDLMLPVEIVCTNAYVARVLLSYDNASKCAQAAFDKFPFPLQDHPFWKSEIGRLLRLVMKKEGLSSTNVKLSPDAFAIKLFPSEWRQRARAVALTRLIQTENALVCIQQLTEQVMSEHACSKARARLLLAAADVHVVEDSFWPQKDGGICAYQTSNGHGIDIFVTQIEFDRPSELRLSALQEDLSLDEQLVFLVLTNDLNSLFQRVSHFQPLPICCGADQSLHDVSKLLQFCDLCSCNYTANDTGKAGKLMYCPDPTCDFFVHEMCAGSMKVCPRHSTRQLIAYDPTEESEVSSASVATVCDGLLPVFGAWCFSLHKLCDARNSNSLLLLHPNSFEFVVDCANSCIDAKHWFSEQLSHQHSTAGVVAKSRTSSQSLSKRCLDVFAHVAALWHCNHHNQAPFRWSLPNKPASIFKRGDGHYQVLNEAFQLPQMRSMTSCAQWTSSGCGALRLGTSFATALKKLQVYSEPHFSAMCDRMQLTTKADLDDILLRWMHLCLPILCGKHCSTHTESDASCMHARACCSILSAKTKERALDGGHELRHVCVAQEDPVFPQSEDDEMMMWSKLDISDVPPLVKPSQPIATSPDILNRCDLSKQSDLDYRACAVFILIFPEQHIVVLRRIISDASSAFELSNAETVLKNAQRRDQHRVARHLTREDLLYFQSLCIQSPIFGRLFLWILSHGERYCESWPRSVFESVVDCYRCERKQQKGMLWSCVEPLRLCTASSVVILGCGAMKQWRSALMHNQSTYLFETDDRYLRQLAELPIHDKNVHVVPCSWNNLDLSLFACQSLLVVSQQQEVQKLRMGSVDAHILCQLKQDMLSDYFVQKYFSWYQYAAKRESYNRFQRVFQTYRIMGGHPQTSNKE